MKILVSGLTLLAALALAATARSACCYFSAQDKDVDQPGQKAFITWDPAGKRESFTVQPSFQGDARDFGMVIPTPSRPKLDEMPRDFFKHLALYTILLPFPERIQTPEEMLQWRKAPPAPMMSMSAGGGGGRVYEMRTRRPSGVKVLESGVVGSLDYKILEAERANGLFEWLKENNYTYSGDEETLKFYIDKKWVFTVMKIDTKQMKTSSTGAYKGEVTPTRFAFASDALTYPLRITAISVKKNTEALFYVQAPEQMDLKDTWSWLWSYRVMWLNSGTVCISQKQMTDAEQSELRERSAKLNAIRQEIPGYDTTKLEWAHRIGDADVKVLDNPGEHWRQGGLPDLPAGAAEISLDTIQAEFAADIAKMSEGDQKLIGDYPQQTAQNHPADKGVIVKKAPAGDQPAGYFFFKHREAPAPEVAALTQLKGHLTPGQFITKFRKSFLKHEMKHDLEMVPVQKEFATEYLRILPMSPP